MRRIDTQDVPGVRWIPDEPTGVGALVLAGSSGRIDSQRAELLARHGVTAESIRWFGGPGQHDGPWEIPLELFLGRIADLAKDCERVLVLGTSFGAEAALLAGGLSADVSAVVAFAPSDVVWGGVGPDGRPCLHWTRGGVPLAYVPFDDGWTSEDDIPAYAGLYQASRRRFGEYVAKAAIPVEAINDLVIVAGGDDQGAPAVQCVAERQPGVVGPLLSTGRWWCRRRTFVTGRRASGGKTDLVKSTVASGGTLKLSAEECWDLLTASTVGRVGFTQDGGIKIIPVNYVLDGRTLIIRTSPTSSVAAIPDSTMEVAFQVDYHGAVTGSGWSVLLNGTAIVLTEDEVAALEMPSRIVPWAGGDRSLHLRFTPRTIEGRRVTRHR